MPIEIKELVIKTTITEAVTNISDTESKDTKALNEIEINDKLMEIKRAIVSECMDNVSHLLKQLNDR